MWAESHIFPTTHGSYLNAPFGIEIDGQQLYLGSRSEEVRSSQKWAALMVSQMGSGSGRRSSAMGPIPVAPAGTGSRSSVVGSGGPVAETRFALPSQYNCEEYRDNSVPEAAGPVDEKFSSTEPVPRRAAWCGYFLRLIEAIRRVLPLAYAQVSE